METQLWQNLKSLQQKLFFGQCVWKCPNTNANHSQALKHKKGTTRSSTANSKNH